MNDYIVYIRAGVAWSTMVAAPDEASAKSMAQEELLQNVDGIETYDNIEVVQTDGDKSTT